MKNLETITFAISFAVAFAGMANILPNTIAIILVLFALFYLSIGWTLISKCRGWLRFLITYLIAQSLVAVLFGIRNWPMKDVFGFYTIATLLIMILYLSFKKEALIAEKHPVNKYLNRMLICLMLAMSPIWLPI